MAAEGEIVAGSSSDKTSEEQESDARPSIADYTCPICLQILVEPVVLPCEHELCIWCFRQNVEEANLQCPLCRIRISSWARRHARNGTLVNLKRWEQIKRIFPEKCQKRMRGEDNDDDDEVFPKPKRKISDTGEVRKEYEEEVKKIRQAQEEEIRRTEEVIQKLLQEEQKLQQTLECQQKQDEMLAKELSQRDKENDQEVRSPIPSSSKSPASSSSQKRKKSGSSVSKSKLVTLDRWLLNKNKPTDSEVNEEQSKVTNDVSDSSLSPSGCSTLESSKLSRNVDYEQFDPGYTEWLRQKRIQEEQDFLLAQKLQNELDHEQKETNRKEKITEGYLLRKVSRSTTAR